MSVIGGRGFRLPSLGRVLLLAAAAASAASAQASPGQPSPAQPSTGQPRPAEPSTVPTTTAPTSAGSAARTSALLSPADSMLLRIAMALVRGKEDADRQWYAPWFSGEFLVLRPDGGALAVFERALPIALEPPTSYHPLVELFGAYFLPPGRDAVPTRFTLPTFEGRRVVAFPLLDSVYSIADPLLATVAAVYHESFHVYQLRNPGFFEGPQGADAEIPRELIVEPEFQALAKRERELLASALYQSDPDSTKALLRTYLATRARRTALLPAEHRLSEASVERFEAAAHLVSYRAALLTVEGSAADVEALISSDLRNTPAFDDPTRTSSPLRQWQIYASGAAIALLLERLGVPWQREVEQGATFEALLARAVAR